MASLKHTVTILHRKNSQSHVFFLVVFLTLVFVAAVALRYYVVEPIKMVNASMAPRHKENSWLWMCKLPQYIDQVQKKETVWRKVIAMPGDTLSISESGKVVSGKLKFRWKGENAFIESRSIYVPRQGDTLYFDKMNDVEQDYAISLLHEQGIPFFIKTTLWQGDREINVERIGSTKLGNRQVRLQEIDLLPWQDRFLIELQIRQSEPGNAPIKIKREIFNEDSTVMEKFIVEEDCYYLACERGNRCVDSRETGFFTKSRILGRYMPLPNKIKNTAVKKIREIIAPKKK